jgi:Flp pilus assembly protein TadG
MKLRRLIDCFRRDDSGNVLIMAGIASATLVGGAGLATDGTQWFLWKRQIQMAADAGALGAAYTIGQNSTAITAPATRGDTA